MDINQHICAAIGYFYYEKNFKNNSMTTEQIENLGIYKVNYNKKTHKVEITLERPGLLIGKKGENINKLVKFILNNTQIPKYKKYFFKRKKEFNIYIIEEKRLTFLYNYQYCYYKN